MKKNVRVKAPGKLYVAGEYAVVEPGHKSIIVAVDRFIHTLITPAKLNNLSSIFSTINGNVPIHWKYTEDNQFELQENENPFPPITETINTVSQYMVENNYELEPFDLHFRTTMDGESGDKFGIGSSGAVTVATIKAMDVYFNLNLSNRQIFKLGALTHLKLGSTGSFGDIATSTFGGWLAYSSFDRQWVLDHLDKISITELVNAIWPKLRVRPIKVNLDFDFLVGWTKSPASTEKMVSHLKKEIKRDDMDYQLFLSESHRAVENIIDGLQTGDKDKVMENINYNRILLIRLADLTGLTIETPELRQLIESAEQYPDVVAKSSGAGGGDCGIALCFNEESSQKVIEDWENIGITPLPLKITSENVSEDVK